MDEPGALQYIFKNDVKCYINNAGLTYKICVNEKYFEFHCDEDYPNSVPEISSNVDEDILANVREECRRYLSTPMIFDMIRLIIKRLEECDIGEGKRISIVYDVNDDEKITEDEFMDWKRRTMRVERSGDLMTGKRIFLEKKI